MDRLRGKNREKRSHDPLFIVNPKIKCPVCNDERKQRRNCDFCQHSGMMPIDLAGMWFPSPGFLVCGGPSLKSLPIHRLRERGVISFAVNQVASYAPVDGWCFSDPQNKFHHGLHLDPKIMTFSPIPKLRKTINVKLPDGMFRCTNIKLRSCPNTYGFSRKTVFYPENFLTTDYAHWGRGGNMPDRPFTCLCTMLLGFRMLHYLGCPRIYMLGVDLWMTNEEPYAFQQDKRARNKRYSKENTMLSELKPYFDADGFEVFNCNPNSKCDVFSYVPFEEAINDCKGGVPKEPFDTNQWYEKSIARDQIEKNPTPLTWNQVKRIQNLSR